jgi:hypothetical protein
MKQQQVPLLSSNHERVIIVLLLLVTAFIVYRMCRITDTFVTVDEINQEVAKQLQVINDIKTHNPYAQASPQFPHLEIIKKYHENADNMLRPLKELSIARQSNFEKELGVLNRDINSLTKYVKDDTINNMTVKNINALKSWNNGLELSVKRLDKKANAYMVGLNGGCLSVPPDNAASVVACNQSDPNQIFSLNHVFNEVGYQSQLDSNYPRLNTLKDVTYPFSMLKAKTNGNCVKNFHGELSVEPCREYDGQRWAGIITDRNKGQC